MIFYRGSAFSGETRAFGAQIARLACVVALSFVVSIPGLRAASANGPLVAHQARIIGDEARTRIVLDFAEEPEFDIHYLDFRRRVSSSISPP